MLLLVRGFYNTASGAVQTAGILVFERQCETPPADSEVAPTIKQRSTARSRRSPGRGKIGVGRRVTITSKEPYPMSTEAAKSLGWEACQDLVETDDALEGAIAKVAELDFSMLKRKLVEEYGWTPEHTDEVEGLYRNFLALNMIYPDRKICPTGPIDEFWHAHILDTRAYAEDCQRLFGDLLHHFPYFGMRGPEDRQNLEQTFESSRELFIRHFGTDPCIGETEARGCSPQRCP